MKASSEKWYDLGIRYSLYALPVLVPVIFSPVFYTVFSAPKLLALRALTLLIMVCWGAKVFVEEKFSCRRGWLNVALLAYAIVSVLNTIFSIAFYTSLYGAQGRFLGIFTVLNLLLLPLFVWNFLNKRKEIMMLLHISVVTACILGAYGILQFFGLFQAGFNWDQIPAERVFGTIGHGNHFGAYLGMNILLGLFLLPTLKKLWHKRVLALGLILQTVTLFLTASRGALGATLMAGAIALVILCYGKWDVVREKIMRWLLPGFIIVSIIIAAAVVLEQDLRKIPLVERTFATISAAQEGRIPDRFSWWLSSIDMIKDKPLLGFGLSTFRDAYNQYRRRDYQTVEAQGQQDHITPEAAHNEYLNIGVTQGLLGLAAFLGMIAFVFWRMDKVLFSGKEDELFYPVLGVKAALMVYLLEVFISFGVIATLTIFYLFLGVGLALADQKVRVKEVRVKGLVKYVLAIFLLSGISAGAVGAYREAVAEVHYKQAFLHAQDGDINRAVEEFEKMIAAKPFDYAYHQTYGDFALKYARTPGIPEDTKLQLLGSAALSYENALVINHHHPSTSYNLGIAYLEIYARTGDLASYDRAVYNLNESVAKAVNNPLYPYQSARAFMAIETDEAREKAAELLEEALAIRTPYADAEAALEQLRQVLEVGLGPELTSEQKVMN